MTKQTIHIPTGYKPSPLGIIPKDWEVKRLGELGNFSKGNGVPKDKIIKDANEHPCLTYGDLYTKYDFVIKDIKSFIDDDVASESKEIHIGDICFAGSGETPEDIGKCAAYIEERTAYAGGDIIILAPNKDINSIWLSYALNSDIGGKQRYKFAQGFSIVHIYPDYLKQIQIPTPTFTEQNSIVSVLSLWDTAISKQTALIEKLTLRKRGLMQQLLTGKKRLKGFEGEWKKCAIKSFTKEVSIRNTDNKDYVVLSCTKYDGLVPSLEYFGKQIYSNDLSTYKVVPKNHFAYATNHIEEGSIGYQAHYNNGLISPMYTVFETDKEKVDDTYLFAVLKSHHLIYLYQAMMEGSINRRGGLRWDSFSTIKVDLPSLEEQKTISTFLHNAEKEIEIQKKRLTNLQEQKKGLMQVLLTGKKRITTI